MASTAFSKAASCPWSSAGKRSSIVWLSRRPAAIRTPSARSQGASSSTAPAPWARGSSWVASITNTEGPWPRRNSRQAVWIGSPAAAAVGEARLLQDLQPFEGRQRLRPVQAGHGAL